MWSPDPDPEKKVDYMSQYRRSSNPCGQVPGSIPGPATGLNTAAAVTHVVYFFVSFKYIIMMSQYRRSSNPCGPTDYQIIEKTMI